MNNENSDLALHQAQTKHALNARVSSLALNSIKPEKTDDKDGKLFLPPEG